MEVVKQAQIFANLIIKKYGKIVPDYTAYKAKHLEVIRKTKHYSDKTKKDGSSCQVFVKKEAYPGKVNFNRMISNQSPDLVAAFTPFTSAIHKHLKKHVPWYMPGKTKLDWRMFANTVGIDFSSFESSQTLAFRMVEYYIANLFETKNAAYLQELLMAELNTDFKISFKTSTDGKIHAKDRAKFMYLCALALRLSGSAWTTIGNTLVAGFLQFLYYTKVRKMTPQQAYDSIRYCYGDDSLLKDGEMAGFIKYVAQHGFIVTVESHKGPGQQSCVGKVISLNGSKTVDAVRVLNKFLIAFGKYDYSTNLFNKWAGNYNPQASTESMNIFSLIGKEAYRRVLEKGKLDQNEYKSYVDTHDINATFAVAFQGKHGRLKRDWFDKIETILGLEDRMFISYVSWLITPFVSIMLPTGKPGNIISGNDVLMKGKFTLDVNDQLKKFSMFQTLARKINKSLSVGGSPTHVIKIPNYNAYKDNIIKLCNTADVDYSYIEQAASRGAVLKPNKKVTSNTPRRYLPAFKRGYGKQNKQKRQEDEKSSSENAKKTKQQQKQ